MQNKYKVLTPTGYQYFDSVRRLKKPVVSIDTEMGNIRVTYDHPFVVKGKNILAKNLKIGDFLESKTSLIMVNNIKPDGVDWVYDLINVQNGSVYYANDILVHNCFHKPGKSILSVEVMETLEKACKEPILVTDDGKYKIFCYPNEKSFYGIGVDVGEGIGRTNTVAQILDVSDLTSIKQVAIYSANDITPYHFGTRLMGIINDWGRPPVLIENNSYGQQVLDVVARTHLYENVVTYRFEGMSKHYNNENRLGVHNHTNTRYRAMTNFRYWLDALKAVEIYDYDTLLEIAEFVQLPNYTFSKKSETDRDDRVWSLAWGLFILELSVAQKYFQIDETDEQGRPMTIRPLTNNSDLIKKSPIFSGNVNTFKKEANYTMPSTFIPSGDTDISDGMEKELVDLKSWLHQWSPKIVDHNPYKQHSPEILYGSNKVIKKEPEPKEEYRPIFLF